MEGPGLLEPRVLAMLRGQEVHYRTRSAPGAPTDPAAAKVRMASRGRDREGYNEQVIKCMVATTKFIWDRRYGITETKNTREN